jgi:TolB protein
MIRKFNWCTLIFLLLQLATANLAIADQNIDIVGGSNAGNPKIAIVNFTNDKSTGDNSMAATIANDLKITGEFNVLQPDDVSTVENNVQYILTGSVSDGTVSYKLTSKHKTGVKPLNKTLSFKADVRKAAHTIANAVYKDITNVKGAFTSKIAYIAKNGGNYKLIVSDYDGYNQKPVFSGSSAITSISWNSSGKQIAYVSFESGKPIAYVQDIYTGNRYKVANFNGSNSSPSFAPNGQLAVTLSKDYGSHIYFVNNKPFSAGTTANRTFKNFATIETEASFANNGNMVFTSDHDGGPQIFLSSISGTTPTRLTIGLGKYNTTAKFSHDASKITFINRNSGVLKAYVMDLSSKSAYPVSLNTSTDMSPSFAPNDKLVLFSSDNGMYISNVTGTAQSYLKHIDADSIIDQQWSHNF